MSEAQVTQKLTPFTSTSLFMATANSTTTPMASSSPTEEETSRALQKRYESLMMVRNKAINGKGAWYWFHLEPILFHSPDTALPTSLKLRCSLCLAQFSASNPSRTASEHLKRGTCPNFTSPSSSSSPQPISSLAPPHHRKRPTTPHHVSNPLAIVDYTSKQEEDDHGLVLSGGKNDLEALAMLEHNVKRLKSPKASPCTMLGNAQAELAMTHFADWVYECCGAVSLSSLDHPKFRAFLRHVGLPGFSCRDLVGPRLSARYEEVLRESEARIGDALFFQVASHGWNDQGLVTLTLNLPNGTSLFHKAVFIDRKVQARFAHDLLWETITGICGGELRRCAGVVSTKFKLKALGELEKRNQWMVNLPCQLQGVSSLLKDFVRGLPLFRAVVSKCKTIAHFFTTDPNASASFKELALREQLDQSSLLPAPFDSSLTSGSRITDNFLNAIVLMEDVMAYGRELHRIVVEESGSRGAGDRFPTEVVKTVLDLGFWNELEAALSLVNLTREVVQEIESERPFVGQCLPMWDELRLKAKDWCSKYVIAEAPVIEVIERRFRKNYRPAWSAAFVLDPLYLMKDNNGKYLPPFKCLTQEQTEDIDRLISRLVSPEEARVALIELLKWRSEGLDRDYALAVQVKQRDPATGKMRIANPLSSRLVWESHLREFKSLGKVALRLIFLHATACGFKCNMSFLRWVGARRRRSASTCLERAQKMVFVAANEKLKRGDFSSEEEKDAVLFCCGEDGVLEEGLKGASSL